MKKLLILATAVVAISSITSCTKSKEKCGHCVTSDGVSRDKHCGSDAYLDTYKTPCETDLGSGAGTWVND